MIVAFDFDGTVVEHQFPKIGPPLPGAIETLRALQDAGHTLILWTCRKGLELQAALEWLDAQGVYPECVNCNTPEMEVEFGGDTRKVFANVYIDDRNLGGFPGWAAVWNAFLPPRDEW